SFPGRSSTTDVRSASDSSDSSAACGARASTRHPTIARMPFGPVAPFDLVALEERVLARWREDDVVDQVRKARADGDPWIFYEGPPTANGRPGLHHVWARVFKDLYPRFQTMRGRLVPRKGGWDCHGL